MTYAITITFFLVGVMEIIAICANCKKHGVLINVLIAIWAIYCAFWCAYHLWGETIV